MSNEFFRIKKGVNLSPTNPASIASPEVGDIIVDSSDNNKLKRYDDLTSSWKDVGSGVGGINYISNNSDFEGGTVGYTTYANAAGAAPVDGTSGTATFVTIGTDSVSPLRGTKSGLISKTASNAQGQGVSYDFTIDSADQAQVLRISFDYNTEASTTSYVDGDIRVYVYDVTNSRLIEVIDRDLLASSKGKFVGTFQTSPDSLSYRVIFHVASVNASAYSVEIDNVIVGPQTIVKGAIVTDWEAFTPNFSNVTLGTGGVVEGKFRRNASNMEIEASITLGTGGLISGTLSFNMPLGYSIGDTLNNDLSGLVRVFDSSLSTRYVGFAARSSPTSQVIVFSGPSSNNVYNATVPFTWATGDIFVFKISVPIQGWSSNMVLSEDAGNRLIMEGMTTTVATSVANGGLEKVLLNQIIHSTTNNSNIGSNRIDIPESGYYRVVASVTLLSGANTGRIIGRIYKTGTPLVLSNAAGNSLGNDTANVVWEGLASKGDYFELYVTNETGGVATIVNNPNSTYLLVSKVSSPQTIAASEVVAAKYKQSSGQNMVVNFNNKIDFSTKVYDTHNAVTTGSNWRFTSPISGYYRITAAALFESGITWTAANRYQVDVALRNSAGTLITAETIAYKRIEATITTNIGPSNGSSTEVFMSKGDYIEITLNHNRTAGDASLIVSDSLNYVTISKINGVS